MTLRRSPLTRFSNAQDPVSSIPVAARRNRDRTWDRAHPVISYSIPPSLHEKAKDIRSSIFALAQKHMTTISSVASALMSFSLAQVRQGTLNIEVHSSSTRKKALLTWEESDEGPQEIQLPEKHNSGIKRMYLGYRWNRDIDSQIKGLAGDSVSPGETMVFLLSYGLEAYKHGKLRLVEESMVITQKVTPSW